MSQAEFARLTEPFRRELFAHCYRMVGSLDEAEDLVQETYMRAWRGFATFKGEASLRAWMHTIATNTTLTAIERRARRWLPSALGPAVDDPDASPPPDHEVAWIQPAPDSAVAAEDPARAVASRESVRLAFVAALQVLPPKQRAILLLCEVIGFSAEEVASMLATTVAAVKSALQRARAALDVAEPRPERLEDPRDPLIRAHLETYIAAFERSDLALLERVLREDAAIEVVPSRGWFAGRATCLRFLARFLAAPGDWRMRATHANGQPAALVHFRGAPFGVAVLEASRAGISRIVAFSEPALVARFEAVLS